ncbi:MAG: hypothetical protein CMJ64_06735 [Planctomycetaceae bacterium]|nr:hypothetical protein [Planctomycetaceae bacterium]
MNLSPTCLITLTICFASALRAEVNDVAKEYRDLIREDQPVAYWDFSEEDGKTVTSSVGEPKLSGTLEDSAKLGSAGPRPTEYPRFAKENRALTVNGSKAYIRVADPGEDSQLDFANGDALTIEAWVRPEAIPNDQQVYIVGKGRTNNKGFPRDNQNYALRLRWMNGATHVSFLFRSVSAKDSSQQFNRWNSTVGFIADGAWHHVAIVYEFGNGEKVRAYVDGEQSAGTWDMGGPTKDQPVVDNDELWIASASGGNPGNSFRGQLDEIAIYRRALSAERLIARYQHNKPDPRVAEFAAAETLKADIVNAELYEKVPDGAMWQLQLGKPVFEYEQPAFAFVGFPKKYTATGVIADRSNPFVLRARVRRIVSKDGAGTYQLLLRHKNAARLYVDGQLVTQTNPTSRNASGHEEVPELAESEHPDLRLLPPACQERLVTIELTPGEHIIRLDAMIGGKGLRLELDELCVAIAKPDEPFRLLAGEAAFHLPLTDEAWDAHRAELRQLLSGIDRNTRRESAQEWALYWERRHELARDGIEQQPTPEIPSLTEGTPAFNKVDHFIASKLSAAGVEPAELTNDYAFLRRVALDAVGVIPTREEIELFINDKSDERRTNAIARYLDDPRWADHWVGYWQDVLAENPGILKPKLNNTGPFRWWIYESFLDNKPMDRFVTELVMMEGSKYYGGPAGFAMATQNDVPYAAKAHVLVKAFLAMDMTCARCHDAPYHPFKQRQLFSLAAMLERKPITLPETSSVPIGEGARKPLVEITLKPGEKIEPKFPFGSSDETSFSEGVLQRKNDPREQLAVALTSSHQDRFAKVIVNRLWQLYLGRGLIEPVDDWELAEGKASHPELLDYLSKEFTLSGFDLKHAASLILNSHAYQRQVTLDSDKKAQFFASPERRRVSAEQLVDSLFVVSGKQFDAESLTLDPDGRRPVDTFLNLGSPDHAWQLTSLSNERDRPALALPMSQSIIDLLLAYGWRESRPNPLTVRDDTPTVLQPLSLANGVIGSRAVRLSDDSVLTEIVLEAKTSDELIERVCLQILSRPPTADEREMFAAIIADGFSDRVISTKPTKAVRRSRRNAVSWSNHLSAEATRIKLELERQIRAGDPPTERLMSGWRERMEDVVWALVNSPEFVFIP